TPAEEHLKSLGISTIVICGTDFPASPRSTVYAAANRDFRLVLATDAISGATDSGLDEMAQIGAYLMPTDQLLEWLPRNRAAALFHPPFVLSHAHERRAANRNQARGCRPAARPLVQAALPGARPRPAGEAAAHRADPPGWQARQG